MTNGFTFSSARLLVITILCTFNLKAQNQEAE